MTNCNEINIEAGRLKSIFGKCYNLKAIDLRDVVDLIESVNSCANGSFQLKTVNGQSLFGSGNIVVTATVDGTETKLQQGTGISITGLGSISSPYVINNSSTITVDGSETKINQGSNINIAGTGTVANPYVINAIIPASAVQVNSDWSAISGPAQILNKPSIPSAQVNSDWNSVSGPSMILNKPALSNTNLGYIASVNGGQVTSSTGSFADIPLFNETNAGLMSQQVLNNISADSDNIKTEILIDMPATESNDSFAQKINQLPLFSVSANQIPIFKAVKLEGENPVVFYVELIGKGKGSYGLTGVQLSAQDVKVTSFVLSSGALELEPTTQIIELGVSAVSVLATINSSLPNIVIQDQASGYVIIKGTFNSQTYEEYLWIGAGNIYGSGANQAVLADLKRINDIVVMKAESNYSGTVKTNFTVADPVVYLKESTDQLLSLKQVNLISGTNIKTINGNSLLGSGDIILVTDISGKEDIANKSSSFTASSTVTYANTKALVDGLATKATGTGTANGTNTGDNATNTQYSGLVTNATHSGDATGATVLTLATVNANVGSFGSASIVPQYTVNAKGLTTASANVPIQIAQSQVTSLSADLASKVTTVGTTGNIQRIVGTNQLGNSALVDNGASVTSSLPFLSTGSITGNSFVKAAAATSNILLAGGADIAQTALPYLPLTGGTLTGALNGASAVFSSSVLSQANGFLVNRSTNGTSATPFYDSLIKLNDASFQTGIQVGNAFNSTTGTYLKFMVNSTGGVNTPVDALILNPSGAATFSSSVSAPTFNGALNGNSTTASNAFSRSFKIEGSIPFLELKNTNTFTESYAIFASINETLSGYGNYMFFNAPIGKEFYFDKKATFSSTVTAAGATLTGALNGTSASFSSNVMANVGNVQGITVSSSNSGFLEVGKVGGSRWRFSNDFSGDFLEVIYGASGATPSSSLFKMNPSGAATFSSTVGTSGIVLPSAPAYYNIGSTVAGSALSFGVNSGTFDRDLHFGQTNNSGTFFPAVTLINQTGVLKINSLAGSGIRSVVADASGNLSTTALQSITQLESNSTDLTVWNNGKGNVLTNTSFGDSALRVNGSGSSNSAFGYVSLSSNTAGLSNSAFGHAALNSVQTGNYNTAFGVNAGSNVVNGIGNLYIGSGTQSISSGVVNETVIGYNTVGSGGNTVTLGNTDVIRTVLRGAVKQTGYTVATLPAGVQGLFSYVTDALAPTYMTAVAGGGSIVTPVFHNGTSWVAH